MSDEFAIENLIDRPDPLLKFMWRCTHLPFKMDENYVESVSLPFPNIDAGDSLYGAGTFFHFPSHVRVDSVSLTFYEDRLLTTTKWLTAWKGKIRNFSKGYYNLPSQYKRNLHFDLINDSLDTIVSVVLVGCWPTQSSNIDLDYTESSNVIISATFSVDAIDIADS